MIDNTKSGLKVLGLICLWVASMLSFAIPLFDYRFLFISKETLPYWIGLSINTILFVGLLKQIDI